MSKHTDGPWDAYWSMKKESLLINCPKGRTLAEVDGDLTPEEQLANGRLMSAAPELLEVAYLARDLVLGMISGIRIRESGSELALKNTEKLNEMLQQILEAILKATTGERRMK